MVILQDSDYVKINSATLLYLIIDKVDGYIEEMNGNKYLILVSADKNKEVLTKYTYLCDKSKYRIKTTHGGKAGEYERFYENKVQYR